MIGVAMNAAKRGWFVSFAKSYPAGSPRCTNGVAERSWIASNSASDPFPRSNSSLIFRGNDPGKRSSNTRSTKLCYEFLLWSKLKYR